MHTNSPRLPWLFGLLLVAVACSQGSIGGRPSSTTSGPTPVKASRTLVTAIRVEPPTLAVRPFRQAPGGLFFTRRMFNADLATLDDKGQTVPVLAERLPELNTESWRVAPDGTMTTTYRLRSGATWHDGAPLTAADFVFAWQVYTLPGLGHAGLAPYFLIQDVAAPDPLTLMINWKAPYADVRFTTGTNTEFPALPRALLEPSLQVDQVEALVNHPWGSSGYVGLGPYRIDRWEPGAFLEAAAFPGYVLGAPKLSRIKVLFITDSRTALANILSGEIDLIDGTGIGLPELVTLKQQWIPQGQGDAVRHPNQWRASAIQQKPDLVSPAALKHPLVRKALAHAVDRALLNDTLYDGEAVLTDSPVPPTSIWGPSAERRSSSYSFDPRRSAELMTQAGFTWDQDGYFTSPEEGRFVIEAKTTQGADNESETAVLASTWRQAGFDAREVTLPATQAANNQIHGTFPGVYTESRGCCEATLLGLRTSAIPTPENRWSGTNRSGWTNPDFDRLIESFSRTLARGEREELMTQLVAIYTEEVGLISLYIRPQVWTYRAPVRGLTVVPPEAFVAWNVHLWELRD